MEKYSGLVVIIVNVASYCGLTSSNYSELKALNDKYYERGLRIAAFPCNQFGFQEPYCEASVNTFVKEKFDFEPDLYGKVLVNGGIVIGKEAPLWAFLKKEQEGTLTNSIKWNFTKFLIDRKGKVVERYGPTTNPSSFEDRIEELLNQEP